MFDFVMGGSNVNRVSEEDISGVERAYEIRFPDVLRSYFLQHNGRAIHPAWFRIDENIFSVWKIPELKSPEDSLERLLKIQRLQDFPVREMIPVADDCGGGLYYWHSITDRIYYSTMSGEDDFELICSGIDQFFAILDRAYLGDLDSPLDITEITRRDEKMAKFDFLPLGSVVLLKGGTRKVLIIARGLNVRREDETYFFDYGGVVYPDGLTSDQMVYFDHDGIVKVYFHGYTDDEDDVVQTALGAYLESHPNLNRADPLKWLPGDAGE